MKVFRYWALREQSVTDAKGARLWLRAWGGADTNAADAERVAQSRLAQWIERIRTGIGARSGDVDYSYGHGEMREELLDAMPGEDGLTWAITRNRYGAEVLSTARLAILDVDQRTRGFREWLRWLFKPQARRDAHDQERIAQWARTRPGVAARLYKTRAGFRVLLTHRPMDPTEAETRTIMHELSVDRLYARLCESQHCFRARLTPKPWRLGLQRIHWIPVDDGKPRRDSDQRWLHEYQTKSKAFAACRWIADLGDARAADPALADLVALHDQRSGALSGRPLA